MLCACGSGLRRVRCCGMDLAGEVQVDAARHLTPVLERALQAFHANDGAVAERLALDVLELCPTQARALRILYDIKKAAGADGAAEVVLRRLVALDPNDLAATLELARSLLQRGSLSEAELHGRNAVRIAPGNAAAHNVLAMVLTESHRPVPGAFHYRRALELSGQRDPIVLANLAWNLKTQGRVAEARCLYEESAAAAPDVLQTLLGWAKLEEVDRNFTAAGQLLGRAECVSPKHPSVALADAVLLGRLQRHQEALERLDRIAQKTPDQRLGPMELLEKGRLLDRLGRYDDAWQCFTDAKRQLRETTGQSYLADPAVALAARLKGFFVAERLATLPRAGIRTDTPQPIFVTGFPRSGTTLVEQTLSAHRAISAGDELPIIAEIANLLPRMLDSPLSYPEALAELWMGDRQQALDHLRDYYLQRAEQLGAISHDARWFTDKMPLNETHLGLIALIFPGSPVIHLVRHPLDTILSVFSNQLTHGFYCASALESVARHYALISDLVEHYFQHVQIRHLTIRYEALVADQEQAVRAMLECIGEDFDEGCLEFHRNRRYARTASYAQVAEPLYDRSVFRYRHYLRHLEPVLPEIQQATERLGYLISPE